MALQEDRIGDGITVIGAGTTGYLTTLFLCKNYPGTPITWIYPKDNNPIGVGEATVPAVTDFLKELGITPETVLKELNGSLKLGIKFDGFYEDGESFYHPFGDTDEEAHQIKSMMLTDTVPNNILDYNEIATHFDVRELMRYIDNKMNFDNLTIIRDTVDSVYDPSDSIVIDCTGFNKLQQKQFKDITDKIPNDKALVYRHKYTNDEQRKPYTTAVAMENGWIWNIPLGDQLSLGYVYDSKYNVRDEFKKYIVNTFGECNEENIYEINMITGRNEKHIVEENGKTIITLGLSSFFIEPLESTGLYLVGYGIELLDKYLKNYITAEAYNIIYNEEYDIILDFIIAHYKYSTRDNEYWKQYRNIDITEFKENNIFPERSWMYIMDGMKQTSYSHEVSIKDIREIRKFIPFKDWYEKNAS